MNRQIGTLFRLAAIGIALLITITAYWQIWAASSLASRRDNARLVYRQLQIKRGLILASNGHTVLARNHAVHRDGLTLYERRYPYGPLFAHAIGYNTVGDGRTALELAENPYLTASNSNLATVISNLSSTLQGETVTGDNVITSLSVPAQRAAQQGLSGLVGAVVAMEPSTGRVIAMYSSPSFNPTHVDQNFARLNRVGGAPLLNRVTQGLYAPGSTFKIVTATGALNAGFTPQQLEINAQGHCITDEGHALCNAGTESYGTIDLETALTNSVNTYFAQLGQHLGQTRLEDIMRKFGFFQLPQFTYPTDEMNASGLYSGGRLIGVERPHRRRPRRDRAGAPRGDAAADGRGRGDGRKRRRADGAEPGGQGRHALRTHRLHRQAAGGRAGHVARHGVRARDRYAERGRRGHRPGGPPAGQPFDRREDRNGRDGHGRNQHGLVHRLRSRACIPRSPWRSSSSTRRTSAGRFRRPSPPR